MSRLNSFLNGIRVLDLSRHLPGPLATLFLADMGAEVLKIEPPAGDELRVMGPTGPENRSVYFDAVNAGKTTRRMDLKREDTRGAFLELVKTFDVLVESFRPNVMPRLGLGHETLTALNPRLIYCSLSGFGSSGPLADRAAHDVNYLSLAGTLHHNGASLVSLFEPPIADCAGALFAALSIVSALHGRADDGKGCHLDLALSDVVMPLQLFPLAELGLTGTPPQPGTSLLSGGAASNRVYETADGHRVSLGALEPKFWRAFCAAAQRPEWEARHREPLPQTGLTAEVAAMFRGLTRAECQDRFADADCCFAPIVDLREAIGSAHVKSRRLLHRTADGALQALFPAVVDGEPPAARRPLRDEA